MSPSEMDKQAELRRRSRRLVRCAAIGFALALLATLVGLLATASALGHSSEIFGRGEAATARTAILAVSELPLVRGAWLAAVLAWATASMAMAGAGLLAIRARASSQRA